MAFFSRSQSKSGTIHAFSSEHAELAPELVTEVLVSQAFNPSQEEGHQLPVRTYRAVWDTGATGSCITPRVVKELGLSVIGKIICHHVQGKSLTSKYFVNIVLPNRIGVSEISVTEGEISDDIDVLIGMDIITLGDFAISNVNGRTHFTFRTPSCERICFIEQGERMQAALAKASTPVATGPSRNMPCPCGSGKKYKRCCGAFKPRKW